MEHMLTSRDVRELQDVVRIGDLLLLPRGRLPNLSESLALQKAGVIDIHHSQIVRNKLWRNQLSMESNYSEHRLKYGEEPAWMRNEPLHVRRYFRSWYATTQEDPLCIIGSLPHTQLSYMIVEGGLTEEAVHLFRLFRLQGVNQLGFLQAPWVARFDWPLIDRLTHVTRYVHSCDVTAIGSVIGRNLALSENELNTLQTACLTHDWGTPAGGDSVKLIDPKEFDEDLNFPRLLREKLDRQKWNDFREKYGVDEGVLCRTILNEGLLGGILDVADKLAYVGRDIDTCLRVGVATYPGDFDAGDAYVGTRALQEIVNEYPQVCDVWDSVRREGERVFFSDAARLIAFLKARIVLFRELYYHPRARFGEYLISRLLVKKLYDRGDLTREKLLEMNDHALERMLEQAFGKKQIIRAFSSKTQVCSFKERTEAIEFKEDLQRKGVSLVLVEDHLHAIKPGTQFLVESPEGVLPLQEAYPGDAAELYEMATMLPAVHVYYLADAELSHEERQGFLELQP